MNDLISRQAAIDDIETVNPSMPLNVNWVKTLPPAQPEITKEAVELYCRQRCLTVITNELFNEMKAKWSAQPEIIKCRDCIYHHTQDGIPYCDKHSYGYGWKDEDYCSYAERRTDG